MRPDRICSVSSQLKMVKGLFPGELGDLEANGYVALRNLRPEAEGFFVIPGWRALAPTYCEAVGKVLRVCVSHRGLIDNYAGKMGREYLRACERSEQMWRSVCLAQGRKGRNDGKDVLVLPAQLGRRYKSRSPQRARQLYEADEFGLGVYAVGMMLLANPAYLSERGDVNIDCAGDEYAPHADGIFSNTPFFEYQGAGRIMLDTYWSQYVDANYGSATGFIP